MNKYNTNSFITKCVNKFGNNNDDLSQVDYVDSKTKIKVIDKEHGEYWITPAEYLRGRRSRMRQYIDNGNRRRLDKQNLIDRIKTVLPDIEVDLSNYSSTISKVFVKDKYGVCRVYISSLLVGCPPTIKTAINPTEYFISKARELHGDKYDYSLVEYKNKNTKVKIISPNGIFEQSPNNHLGGNGCPIEKQKTISKYMRDNHRGWSYKGWQKLAEKSKYFTGYKVYFLECWDEETNEKFYKIGKTYNDITRRYKNKKDLNYYYNILHSITLPTAREACELEQKVQNKHKEFRYIPIKKFGGMFECFSELTIN